MMQRHIWLVGVLALAVRATYAAPARPLYVPEPAAKAPTIQFLDLRGTRWHGQDFVDNYHMTFEADGTLTYGYNNRMNRGGSWTQEDGAVYFEINKKYREFKGNVQGDTLIGESWNITGKRWQTNLRRVSSGK